MPFRGDFVGSHKDALERVRNAGNLLGWHSLQEHVRDTRVEPPLPPAEFLQQRWTCTKVWLSRAVRWYASFKRGSMPELHPSRMLMLPVGAMVVHVAFRMG